MPLEQCSKWEIHSLSNFSFMTMYICKTEKKDDIDKNLILIKKISSQFSTGKVNNFVLAQLFILESVQ